MQGGQHSPESLINRICDVVCPSFELVSLRACNNLQLADNVKLISPRWVTQWNFLQKDKAISGKHICIVFFFCVVTTPTRTILVSEVLAREMEGKTALV